ncbi:hypothetical protein OO014_03540 [Intrasporangium calvum]|uniref:Uncharacterized protein n=1 Tax=Intrasporangium calvum TaxID=53358 RepID=A0ABT5GE09_9MICO|nr:hypothetical protein [Intrasporangium calvum]MDC5696317.1 hypothetical protein [Intrasporangium calvum]
MSDPNTVTYPDPIQVFGRVGELLEATARRVWAQAEAEGPLTPRYTLAQDIHLTAALTAGLVPPDVQVLGLDEVRLPADPVEALREVDALLSGVPVDALPPGASQVVVRLAELVREVRG